MSRRRSELPRESERSFMAAVIEAADLLGWAVYHTHRSEHSASGFPDLVLIRPPRLIVAELKRDGEHPTSAQIGWLDAFRACNVDAYVWTPADWATLSEVLRS